MIKLVKPQLKYEKSFLEALKEFKMDDQNYSNSFDDTENNFTKYISRLEDSEKGINLKDGYVPFTTLFLVDDDEYIGRVSIRHSLNDTLLKEGGHVGYDIRPSKRKMGYGTKILELALPIAKELGINKVLLTCKDSNIGSYKIMEKNGAVLQDKIEYNGHLKRRYWITIK
jgi:predicted acetyltransferase